MSRFQTLAFDCNVRPYNVGNKCAVFTLQLHGFDVDPVMSVQFSNHTGYGAWKGEVMTGEQLWSLAGELS